jgi:uncharacterized protein (TIGR00730 family)/Cys-tRNA(Pro) deacylase
VTSLCIFCGSSPGARPRYRDAAEALGAELARRGIRLIYGGGHVGLMGVVADAALAVGGDVVGVITEGLQAREVGHAGLPDLRVVATMHERKAMMASLADAFVALPGGAGTLDEFFEAWTWLQLGIHRKPVGLLNVEGYYNPLLAFLDRGVEDRFIRAEYLDALVIDTEVGRLLDRLEQAGPVRSDIKTLVFGESPRSPFLMLMHGDREVSAKKLARALGVKSVAPCEPAVAERVTGYQVGGISPFGTRQRLPVYVEASVLGLPRLYVNGGRRGLLVSMAPSALAAALATTTVHTT